MNKSQPDVVLMMRAKPDMGDERFDLTTSLRTGAPARLALQADVIASLGAAARR
jgi:hypothetical protein